MALHFKKSEYRLICGTCERVETLCSSTVRQKDKRTLDSRGLKLRRMIQMSGDSAPRTPVCTIRAWTGDYPAPFPFPRLCAGRGLPHAPQGYPFSSVSGYGSGGGLTNSPATSWSQAAWARAHSASTWLIYMCEGHGSTVAEVRQPLAYRHTA